MMRNRKRTTDNGQSTDVLEQAAKDVREKGISERKAAADYNVPGTTLKRYILARTPEKVKIGTYKGVSAASSVFTSRQGKELADHIAAVDNVVHGLSARQTRELAYQYASRNNIKTPNSWETNKIAG